MFVDAPPSWDEIANTKEFQSLTPNEKANVQRRWVFDRMNYDYDRGNEIDQRAMVKEFKKNGFEPTVINTGFKDFTDYRSYMEGQQAEGLQGKAREEALSPQYSFGEGLLVSNEQRMGALGAGLVRPFEGMAGLADMTVGKALEAVTGSRMGIDKLADNLHGIVADMGRGVETDVIHGFSEGGFGGGVNALVNMVLMEAPNQIIQLGIGAAGIPQPYALAMLGASSMGSQYNDLKNDRSLSELQKYSIATLNGAIEGVTELMDSIPFIKRMTSSTKQAIFREALRSKPFRTIGKEFLKTFGGEAAEEATGELLQNISEAVIRGEKIDWKELGVQVANAGIGGGAMGGMMGVGGVAYNRHADNERTSRKAFQEMKAMQAGFNPASKEFSRIAKSADLPEKYSTREGRRKAVDDYDFHGEPIVFGEATDEDRRAALKERIKWYEGIRDQIEDGDEKAEWEEYYKEWQDKLSALENKPEEPLPKPVDEEGNELGAEEVTTEETPVEQPEPPKEEKPAVVEKPTEEKSKEPPRWVAEHPNHEKSPGGYYLIVDANRDVVVSGDEGYNEEFEEVQNRHEGAEREQQVREISGHPIVDKFFVEGRTDEGPAIAEKYKGDNPKFQGKFIIKSGNGRTKARRLMAVRRTDMEYLNRLKQVKEAKGVDELADIQVPMLLRVLDENLTREQSREFVRLANMEGGGKLAMDAAERSADDAVGMEKHGDKLIGLFTESEGDAIVSASNKEFVSKFRSLIGQRDGDVDSNGLPTSQFERRVANAFLGMLFKNMPVAERNDLLNNLINHGDKYNIVGVYRGLAKKAPKLIKLAQSNKAFALDDILPKALDALLDFKANREQFKNDPDMYLNQPMLGMDKRELKGDERDLFKILATAKYQSQMARVLQDYVDKAKMESTPDLYGETMNRGQLLKSVLAAEQSRLEANGGSAVDAFLDNGSFDDDGMPTVEGARVAETPKKAAKKNPMSRSRAEKVFEPVYMDLTSNPVTDSHVGKIKQAVDDVAEKFGVKVVVHRNNNDLPADVQQDLVAFGGDDIAIQAWVDDSDNIVHVVASQMESPEMAVQKTLHEIVGHIGLAALFKGRNTDAWNDMVENLWEHHKNDIRERCKAYLADFDENTNEGRSELVEEWLARLAETNRKPLWWKSIVSKVRALLRACHVDVAYSDADIQQLLADAATAARRAQDANMEDANIRFSLVTDKKIEQEFNEEGKYIITYRSAMLGDDGKLYPPMATKGGEGMEINKVYKSDEHPELRGKDGKFPLKSDMRDSKASGTVPAAYNPYFHSQAGMLNDQFAVAYDKSKMVTVKCRVLKSDIESGYQAEGAKDPVGYAEWATSGPVTRQMRKRGGRTVILSRYIMPVDIVEQKEVAKWIKDFIGDEDVTIPWNVVNQSLRDELEKIGVKVGSEAEFREAERIKNEKKKQRKVTGKTGNRYSISNLWTGSAADYEKPSLLKIGTGEGAQAFGWGLYASDKRGIAETYAQADFYKRGNLSITYKGKNITNGDGFTLMANGIKVGSVEGLAFSYLFDAMGDVELAKHKIPINFENRKEIQNFIDNGDYEINKGRHLYRQTWFTNKEEGANLLDWHDKIDSEQLNLVESQIDKEDYRDNIKSLLRYVIEDARKKKGMDGRTFYSRIAGALNMEPSVFGNKEKAASEFLYRAGIDGIRYPAASGGMGDGSSGWNYVSFSDTNMRVDEHIRYSIAKPVQDETSPIPQGPNPPIANIMRQRAARSPISNLRALRLPAIVMLGRELGGSLSAVDRIKRMPSALGVFREGTREIEVIRSLVEPHQLGNQWVVPQGQEDQQAEMIKDYWAERGIPRDEIEIVMKTDEAAKEVTIKAIWHDKSQTLFKKVLGHEIGHLIDYNQGETTTHGNVLGTVGGMGYKYLKQIIGETPDNKIDFDKFEKRKKELRKQAEGLAGEKPKDADELKAWRETVKAEYANLLTSECEQNGWFQAAVIREELVANTEWWSGEIGSDPNYRRYRTSPTELFAEAMSVLLNAPEKFAKQLPETWRMLQNYQKERPEFHKAWQGLMRMMNNEEAYTDALMKLAEEGFTADEETEIQIEKEHHDAWRAIKRKIVDSFADVNDASKRLAREGKVTLDETPISNIVSATHQSIKDYYLILAERLSKPLFDAGLTEGDIGKYLEFQRIVNDPSINQGHIINPNGMTVNDAKDALAKLKRTLGKEKWELLDKWHKDFWQLRQETIIRLAEESGMYDKALIEHMKKNEWYSYRAVVEQIYNADGTEKRGMSKIYGLKGTLSPIANPLGWTYDHDMRLMGGILWNQARLKTIQFMKEQFPDLVNKVKKFGVVSNHAPDGFTRLAVLENGQYVEYDVAETWAKGFQSQLDRDTAAILEKAQWITNLYRRAWTTLSPTFLLNNVVRDYLASYQNLSGINRQIGMVEWTKCWMQGMKEAFKFQFKGESELIENMMKSNMFQSGGKGYDMSGRSGELAGSRRMELLRRYGLAEDEQIRRGAIARFTKYLSDHLGVTWLGDKLGKAVSATEMGAKAGGLIALQRNGEFTDAEKQWHVVRHIGSPDFAQRGTATPIWNTLFIFSNAAIQGWNGTLEMAKANPKGFAARFMATTGTAVFIQWALESGALLEAVKALIPDDDEDKNKSVALLEWIKKQYGRITHHNRYNYMCLPIAETDKGHCLAFRMPFAENSKLPAMMLHAVLDQAYTQIKKDGNLWTETWRAALNQAPNFNPVLGLSGDAAIMYGCGWNGYDKYRQRHAVKTKDWEAGGWRRFKGTTAYMIHEYTPFAIVNNMFDLRDNPYWWWNLIGALGPGAWFKFQQYGEAEQSRAVTAEKRRERLNGKASAFYR